MKPVIWILPLIFCTGTVQSLAVKTRNIRVRLQERTDSLINPPLMKQAETMLRFDKNVLDIGTLTEDDAPHTYCFTGKNTGKESIEVTKVSTTCGCTTAGIPAGRILPGETCTITLTYHPKNHPGTIDADAFVYLSASGKQPVARLTLIGKVVPGADAWARYPYAMGKLRLKQNRMEFQEVIAGKQPSERILCGNSGDKPLRLSALVIPEFASFRTEPEVIRPGGEADIVITIDASAVPEERGGSFTFPVIIEGVDARPSERTLDIKVNRIK